MTPQTPKPLSRSFPGGAGLWVLLLVLLFLAFAASLLIGPAGFGAPGLFGAEAIRNGEMSSLIFLEIRLPRALLALLVGASLGMSGAALQGLLRNPLADPGLLGVAPAASLGAVLAIYSGASLAFPLALPVLACAAAGGAAVLLMALSARGGASELILAGVALSALAGALTSLALNLAPSPFAAMEIIFWMLGSVTDRGPDHVVLAAPFMAVGGLLLLIFARPLDALTLGEEAAEGLGVSMRRLRAGIVLGSALCVGAAAAVSGTIGFVGLAAAHLMRPLVGQRPSTLLPASALAGGILLLLSDVLVKVLPTASELRLGVATALLGAPLFLLLVLNARGAGRT